MTETLEVPVVPVLRIPAWAYALMAVAILVFLTLTLDNGTVLRTGANWLHEFVHDGRHILGVPCH
jgi:hypothetical protein